MTADAEVVALQLGRPPRGLRRVAHRCPCGLPDVVETAPRLADGTPFPTLYYLTCPRAAAAMGGSKPRASCGRCSSGWPPTRNCARPTRPPTATTWPGGTEAARAAGVEPLPPGTQSAGGMPARVKCLHALTAHELAVPGPTRWAGRPRHGPGRGGRRARASTPGPEDRRARD